MRKLSIYVETSVWSQALAEDAPQLRAATEQFLARVSDGQYELFVSDIVLIEMARAKQELSMRLRNLVEKHDPHMLDFDDEMDQLAQDYLVQGVVPQSKIEDAQHVAAAVVKDLDVLVSWNYRHLVNLKRKELFHHVSVMNGYFKPLQIVTPPEVEDEG